jgi:hypothetical protein
MKLGAPDPSLPQKPPAEVRSAKAQPPSVLVDELEALAMDE